MRNSCLIVLFICPSVTGTERRKLMSADQCSPVCLHKSPFKITHLQQKSYYLDPSESQSLRRPTRCFKHSFGCCQFFEEWKCLLSHMIRAKLSPVGPAVSENARISGLCRGTQLCDFGPRGRYLDPVWPGAPSRTHLGKCMCVCLGVMLG